MSGIQSLEQISQAVIMGRLWDDGGGREGGGVVVEEMYEWRMGVRKVERVVEVVVAVIVGKRVEEEEEGRRR